MLCEYAVESEKKPTPFSREPFAEAGPILCDKTFEVLTFHSPHGQAYQSGVSIRA